MLAASADLSAPCPVGSTTVNKYVTFIPGLNLDLLKMDTYKMDPEKDHLFKGEFDVVLQLLGERPEMAKAKNQVWTQKLLSHPDVIVMSGRQVN